MKEIKEIIKKYKLNCSIKDFEDNKNNVQDKVYWPFVSEYQHLSESFIEKFQDKIDWGYVSKYQKLSEPFIEKFQNKVNWICVSIYQPLSESFIKKFQNKIEWGYVSMCQILSESFIKKFKNRINIQAQSDCHKKRTKEEKLKEIKDYAEKYNLKFDGEFLYAFRDHDTWNRGAFNKTISYNQKNHRYEDWRCDMNPNNENSFGLGIWPKGNTKIKVNIEDWGTIVKNDISGKARVKAFYLI